MNGFPFNLKKLLLVAILIIPLLSSFAQLLNTPLDRGTLIHIDGECVFISWRFLNQDPDDAAFNVYRYHHQTKEKIKINRSPLRNATCYIDSISYSSDFSYSVELIDTDSTPEETLKSSCIPVFKNGYFSIPLQIPDEVTTSELTYSYSANDASVGDLDGDGCYEIILKWQPSLNQNPPRKGLTGHQLLDAYKLDGTLLWRIDLGKNIRSGAAYTQFLVYDFDEDGKDELLCKTGDGSLDGMGNVIGDASADWRNMDKSSPFFGKIVTGPEYLTLFEGSTGKALDTQNYIPNRYPLNGWGGIGGNGNNDSTGGRADRFTAGVGYLDGKRPSAIFVRGWYGRTVAAAWDVRNNKLIQKWVFDSENGENPYSGQANHQLSIGDLDNDGNDEICVGAMVIDNDGTGLYSTGLRHGDALHISDLDPTHPGLEVFGIHENEGKTKHLATPGVALYDAATGSLLFGLGEGVDVGRGVAADIDPTIQGFENWGGPGGLRDVNGKTISLNTPTSTNFLIWWDGDLTRELLDHNRIDKWDWNLEQTRNLLTAEGCASNNGSKATPCLTADLFGDWREEVIWRSEDNKELRVYSTVIPTTFRIPSLMQDRLYRLGVVAQNVGYNQPPHTSFNVVKQFGE